MTIQSLQRLLALGHVTSSDLVKEAMEKHLQWQHKNAIAILSPLARQQAKRLDEERRRGFLRGPLHGIPLLIKDNILYADGTPTSANSFALKDFIPKTNATLTQHLLDAGAIILGKANLSEFAYFMGDEKTPSGYGSMYGQVKHPVDETIDPYGSSTGSAVAVALGIVNVSIGTETNGSLMAPAYQCQIVSFKPTTGMISRHGIIPISPSQDTPGPMATNVYDCAVIMDVLAMADSQDALTQAIVRPASFLEGMIKPIGKKRIGWITIDGQPYDEIEMALINKTKMRLESQGHEVVTMTMKLPALDNYPTLLYEFKSSLNTFLSTHQQEGAPQSLAAIIAFNKQHSQRCLKYGQATLIKSEQLTDDGSQFQILKSHLLLEAAQLEQQMVALQLEAVFSPTWLGFAPIFGNPSLCLPMGYYQGKPKAMVFVGRKGHDVELLQLGYHHFDLGSPS